MLRLFLRLSLLGILGFLFASSVFLSVNAHPHPLRLLANSRVLVRQVPGTDSSTSVNGHTITETLRALGLDNSTLTLALAINQAGVEPKYTIALVQNLQGLVADPTTLNVQQLNRAIAAYNVIVDKSRLETLEKLQQTSEFLSLKGFLEKLQAMMQ